MLQYKSCVISYHGILCHNMLHVTSTVAMLLVRWFSYRIHGNFRGMKFSLNRKQTGFSRITGSSWKGSMLCTVTNL